MKNNACRTWVVALAGVAALSGCLTGCLSGGMSGEEEEALQDEAAPSVAETQQALSCDQARFLNFASDIVGHIPVVGEVYDVFNSATGLSDYFSCDNTLQEAIRQAQQIAHKAVQTGIANAAKSVLQDLARQLKANANPSYDQLYTLYSIASTQEKVLADLEFASAPVMYNASVLKLGIGRMALEKARQTRNDVAFAKYGRIGLVALEDVASRVQQKKDQLETNFGTWRTSLETLRECDETFGCTTDSNGLLTFPDGSQRRTDSYDCRGRGCSSAETEARQALDRLVASSKAEMRSKIFDGKFVTLLANVAKARSNLTSAIYAQSLTSGRPASAATQSSVYSGRGANLAIDKNSGTYSQTLNRSGSWWMIDLGGAQTVATVYLQTGRSTVTTVQLLDASKKVIATKSNVSVTGQLFVDMGAVRSNVRYVKISRNADVHLSEVQVFRSRLPQ
jgi:hypothetical protein